MSLSGNLYTWGSGGLGQLGLGERRLGGKYPEVCDVDGIWNMNMKCSIWNMEYEMILKRNMCSYAI